jgi:hypothetical protein
LRRQDFTFTDDVPQLSAHHLGGFDAASGRAYLRLRLENAGIKGVSDADLDHIVLLVRGNPLGLRLAATVYVRQGMSAVDQAINRLQTQEAIAEEQIQGMLHQRIVEQLDGDVKKIANPGLIVRRLTVDVIREVLAVPCELNLTKTPAEKDPSSRSAEKAPCSRTPTMSTTASSNRTWRFDHAAVDETRAGQESDRDRRCGGEVLVQGARTGGARGGKSPSPVARRCRGRPESAMVGGGRIRS